MLVAGVTGGASLIESARSRAVMNEIRNYERAIYTFKTVKGRLPGDVMNYGTFGWYSNYHSDFYSKPYYEYKESDFPSSFITEFQKTAGSGVIPTYFVAPHAELYIEGIIDFKPLGNTNTSNKKNSTKGVPNSKAINSNNVVLSFDYIGSNNFPYFLGEPAPNGHYQAGTNKFGGMNELINYVFKGDSNGDGMSPKIIKRVDSKLDDGEHWNGRLRGGCYGKAENGSIDDNTHGYADYDYAIQNGKKCERFSYNF